MLAHFLKHCASNFLSNVVSRQVADCLARGVFSLANMSSSKWEARELTGAELVLENQMSSFRGANLSMKGTLEDERQFQLAPISGMSAFKGWAYNVTGIPALDVIFPAVVSDRNAAQDAVDEVNGVVQDAKLEVNPSRFLTPFSLPLPAPSLS